MIFPDRSPQGLLATRKDLARLKLELHREQARYHAQSISSPLQQARGLLGNSGSLLQPRSTGLTLASIVLTVFGARLGRFGRLARAGVTLYPIYKACKGLNFRKNSRLPHEID